MKSSNLSADAFNKTLELSGSIPEPAIRSGATGQQKHYFEDSKWRDIAPLKGDKVERRRVVIKGGEPAGC